MHICTYKEINVDVHTPLSYAILCHLVVRHKSNGGFVRDVPCNPLTGTHSYCYGKSLFSAHTWKLIYDAYRLTVVKIILIFRSENIRDLLPPTATSGLMTGQERVAFCLKCIKFFFTYYWNTQIRVIEHNFVLVIDKWEWNYKNIQLKKHLQQ